MPLTGGVRFDVQVFTASGTWTKPVWIKSCWADVISGGGSGGGGHGAAVSNARQGGSGGGGGARVQAWLDPTALGSTETVTVGATKSGPAADVAGGVGNDSKFGTTPWVYVYAGGGGAVGSTATARSGAEAAAPKVRGPRARRPRSLAGSRTTA
jgi:hypothetical protein